MSIRCVYDAMVIVQWAALPADRTHASIRALYDNQVHLLLSDTLLNEYLDVLGRPRLWSKLPNLPSRAPFVALELRRLSEWYQNVPTVFNWHEHPGDNHLFDLALAGNADRIVTWETRLLSLLGSESPSVTSLKKLVPGLRVITPAELTAELNNRS